jgi:hypothetical protein
MNYSPYDPYKKQNIKNNNFSLHYSYNIPSRFIINVKEKLQKDNYFKNRRKEMVENNLYNNNNNNDINKTLISEYIVKLYDNKESDIILMDLKKNLSINDKSIKYYTYNYLNNYRSNNNKKGSRLTDDILIVKLKRCNKPCILKSSEYYIAYIIYNFLEKKIKEYIYLDRFIEHKNHFLYFENIIINLKSEKLENIVFYKPIEI